MKTTNIIQCPHCRALIEPWDYVETGDMEGDFSIDCEECGKPIAVKFTTSINFETSQ